MNLRRFAGAAAGLTMLAAAGAACDSDESVFNAEVGECIESIGAASGSIEELPEADCSEDHEAEVIGLVEHEGDDDDFPGLDDLETEAAEECEEDTFEDYTGTTYAESAIVLLYITPSEESWSDGDRETICLGTVPGETVDESFEDNGEDFLIDSDVPGDDDSLDEFADDIDECEGGNMAACDALYAETPAGSEAEAVALSCGGEDPGGDHRGDCEDEFGEETSG